MKLINLFIPFNQFCFVNNQLLLQFLNFIFVWITLYVLICTTTFIYSKIKIYLFFPSSTFLIFIRIWLCITSSFFTYTFVSFPPLINFDNLRFWSCLFMVNNSWNPVNILWIVWTFTQKITHCALCSSAVVTCPGSFISLLKFPFSLSCILEDFDKILRLLFSKMLLMAPLKYKLAH